MDKVVLKKLTFVTADLVSRFHSAKRNVLKSLDENKDDIVKGIDLVENILRDVNPLNINSFVINEIGLRVEQEIVNVDENIYMYQGIKRCFLILQSYDLSEQYTSAKKLKLIIN